MMINCKEAARRSSELRDRPLRGMRRFELWYHLLICKFCKIYYKQIQMLGKLSRLIGKASADSDELLECLSDATLSDDAKERIKQTLISS